MYSQYMCILLYVNLIWCNHTPYIYCQLEWGVDVSSVYVHSLTSETDLVLRYSIDLLSIGVGGRCILIICACCNMLNLNGVMVLHRSIVNWCGGCYILSKCAFCYM